MAIIITSGAHWQLLFMSLGAICHSIIFSVKVCGSIQFSMEGGDQKNFWQQTLVEEIVIVVLGKMKKKRKENDSN